MPRKISQSVFAFFILIIVMIFVGILFWMGRIPFCECGLNLWTWSAWSSATSQHFGDPYSFSHILHGIIFFAGLWFLRKKLSLRLRFTIAVLIEIVWEIFENSSFIINRYRTATASLDYFGDSVLNATGDLLFAMLGFWIAWKLPWKWTLAIVVLIELIMLYLMRDNLTLNVIMLISPIDAIKEWQMAR